MITQKVEMEMISKLSWNTTLFRMESQLFSDDLDRVFVQTSKVLFTLLDESMSVRTCLLVWKKQFSAVKQN